MNIVTPKRPSGFPEYLPAQQIEFNRMINVIAGVYESFGYSPIETPAIELSDILLAKGGGDTEKEIYRFVKGDKEYALHYDLTVPMARYVAEHQNDLVWPFRRYQIQKNWRAERPQKGRFREFLQCDVDIIGSNSVLHDAEVVSVANQIFQRLQIGKFVIRISNRKLLSGFLEGIGLSNKSEAVLRLVDKMDKIGQDALIEELKNVGLGEDDSAQVIDFVNITGSPEEIIDQLRGLSVENSNFQSGLSEVEELFFAIHAANVPKENYIFDLKIVRGLDYYTGTVYETILVDYPEFGSICSGGRYDELTSYYSKTELPGVGISIGLTRLFAALLEANLINGTLPASTAKVLVAQNGDKKVLARALEVAEQLRAKHINCQVYLDDAKFDKQFKYADKLGVPFVVVIGDAEVESGKVVLKDMSTGQQDVFELSEIITRMNN